MPRKARLRMTYNGAVIKETKFGTYAVFKRTAPNCAIRKTLKSLEAAQRWIDTGSVPAIRNSSDAAIAESMLPPGISLIDAVRFYLAKNSETRVPRLSVALAEYRDAVAPALRESTFNGYRQAHSQFLASSGDMQLGAVVPQTVEEAVDGKTVYARNTIIRVMSAFFAWCMKRGYIAENPCSGVSLARVSHGMPSVLSVEDGARLLSHVRTAAPRLVGYFAVGMFAGVRPQEAMRLSAGNFRNGYIVLDGSITKTADTRNVPVAGNLAAWLEEYPFERANKTAVMRYRAHCPVELPQDVLRHSYATYAFEMRKDAAAVAAEMGHGGTDVFFKHYRALARPGDGKKWFSLRP